MDRRAVLTGAVALLVAPAGAAAQAPSRPFRLGILGGSTPTSPESKHVWQAFFDGLRELGYVEGQNIVVEGRFYGDRLEQLPGFATELVRLPVDVILAAAPPAPEEARRATSTIPIVMANHSDPVKSGLAASLARPGGNVTGMSMASIDLRIKQLQLFKEVVPRLSRVAFLRHPAITVDPKELEGPARALKLQGQFVDARTPDELPAAFAAAVRARSDGLIVLGGSMFFAHRAQLAELAVRHRLPTVYLLREHVEAGGLLSYGIDLRDTFRRAAGFVDKILKGAKPGDLPIEQPRKFDLSINLKTARALGIAVPQTVLVRADRVVE